MARSDITSARTSATASTAQGKALARQIASRLIRENPNEWTDLKDHLQAGHDVVSGGYLQTRFLGPAMRIIAALSENERVELQGTAGLVLDQKGILFLCNVVAGEVYARARRAAARMNQW